MGVAVSSGCCRSLRQSNKRIIDPGLLHSLPQQQCDVRSPFRDTETIGDPSKRRMPVRIAVKDRQRVLRRERRLRKIDNEPLFRQQLGFLDLQDDPAEGRQEGRDEAGGPASCADFQKSWQLRSLARRFRGAGNPVPWSIDAAPLISRGRVGNAKSRQTGDDGSFPVGLAFREKIANRPRCSFCKQNWARIHNVVKPYLTLRRKLMLEASSK